jgi:hypothetical protein
VRDGLGTVDEDERAGVVSLTDHLADRVERAERIRLVGEGDEARPRLEEPRVDVRVEPPLRVEWHELEARLAFLGEDLPGHEVRVVLHLGDDDRVAAPDVPAPPRPRDEVDGLGRVADEDDLMGIGDVQELGHRDARVLVGRGRLLACRVDAAVDVRRVASVVALDRVEDRARLQRRRGTVEVGERPAAEVTFEEREVAPDDLRVERRSDAHRASLLRARQATGSATCSASSLSREASTSMPASARMGA